MSAIPTGFHADLVAVLPRVRRFCRALSRSSDEADDLLQTAVERALANTDKWQPGSRLDSWLYRIAQNIMIDWARSRSTRGETASLDMVEQVAGDNGVAIVEGRSDLAQVAHAYATLPAEQRAVMTLVVLDGLTYKEAAEILSVPTGTVMSRLSRARAALESGISLSEDRGS